MKTASDLRIGDIITNVNSSYCLVGKIISFYCTDGAILKGTVEVLQLRKGNDPMNFLILQDLHSTKKHH